MKRINYLAMAVCLSVMMISSCSINDGPEGIYPVSFTAGVGQAEAYASVNNGTDTRASGTSWAANDSIGIFMVTSKWSGIAENAENKKYVTTSGTSFTAATGNEIYYPMDGSSVYFTAYYPYKSGNALTTPFSLTIPTTQTSANQAAIDLLFARTADGYNKASTGAVTLPFEHKLSKIVLNTTAENNVGSSLENMTIVIKGMNTVNTFTISTGLLGTAGTKANITPRTITNGSEYDAIIMPGTYSAGALTVEFTINPTSSKPETFIWNVGATTFASGSEHTYNVTLTRTGITVTGTITTWATGTGGNVTAN